MKRALIIGITGQTGFYLGEDDIVRFEDQYGRAESTEDAK
jgi:GDP-D-mannose dehydratase